MLGFGRGALDRGWLPKGRVRSPTVRLPPNTVEGSARVGPDGNRPPRGRRRFVAGGPALGLTRADFLPLWERNRRLSELDFNRGRARLGYPPITRG